MSEEYCWAITQPLGGGVMLRASKCQCGGVWISTVLPFVYVYLTTGVHVCDLGKMRLAPDLPEGDLNSYVSRDLSSTSLLNFTFIAPVDSRLLPSPS